MNYPQTLEFLFSSLPMFQRIGAAAYKANLNNTLAISKLTNQPQNNFPSIHIAGTNGKGSVTHMLASILQESGFKTGLFTSPHLRDFRERIKINGQMIPESFVVQFVEQYKQDFEIIKPSFFEMTFGLAMQWFSESKIEIAVIETGMGGRLDSTNVISPLVSVITNIGFDHTQFLGVTLQAIATEKAGIIKPGIPVIIGETHPVTAEVFISHASNNQSELIFADQKITLKADDPKIKNGLLNLSAHINHQELKIESPLVADYQLNNISTVLATSHVLSSQYPAFQSLKIEDGIKKTLTNTGFTGRWQTLRQSPLTICDIGHNADGIKAVVDQLKSLKYSHLHFVLGVVNDKDIQSMLALLPVNATYYFCKADIPRGLDAHQLQETAKMHKLIGQVYPSVKNALNAAWAAAEKDDLVFIGGSAFTVAEVV